MTSKLACGSRSVQGISKNVGQPALLGQPDTTISWPCMGWIMNISAFPISIQILEVELHFSVSLWFTISFPLRGRRPRGSTSSSALYDLSCAITSLYLEWLKFLFPHACSSKKENEHTSCAQDPWPWRNKKSDWWENLQNVFLLKFHSIFSKKHCS